MNSLLTRPNAPGRKMVRKQIYLRANQETKLKARAQQQSVTEAELIRQAVDVFLAQSTQNSGAQLPPDELAWQEILASFESARSQYAAGEPHRWTRDDAYDGPRHQRE